MEPLLAKLFVGGIAHQTTEHDMRDHFVKFGEITECIIMREKYTGTGRGFGFVAFMDISVVEHVLKETHYILGKKVDVKLAKPKVEWNQFQQQHDNQPRIDNSCGNHVSQLSNSKIFVGGLPSTLKLNEFYDYFRKFGTITDKVMMYNKETNTPRGFGFITFDCESDAKKVLKNRFHMLKNKQIEVKWAEPAEDHDRNTSVYNDLRFGFGGLGNYESYYSPYGPYWYTNFAHLNSRSPRFFDPIYGYYWYPTPYMYNGFNSQCFKCGSCEIGSFKEPGQCGSEIDANSTIENSKDICAEENGTKNNGHVKLEISKDSCTEENGMINNGKVVKVGTLKACCTTRNYGKNNDKDVKPLIRNCEIMVKDTFENGNKTEIKGCGDDQSVRLKILVTTDNGVFPQSTFENGYTDSLYIRD